MPCARLLLKGFCRLSPLTKQKPRVWNPRTNVNTFMGCVASWLITTKLMKTNFAVSNAGIRGEGGESALPRSLLSLILLSRASIRDKHSAPNNQHPIKVRDARPAWIECRIEQRPAM